VHINFGKDLELAGYSRTRRGKGLLIFCKSKTEGVAMSVSNNLEADTDLVLDF